VALYGHFLAEVQRHVRALSERRSSVIVDAATGAGETTVQIASAMRSGKLITLDIDPAAWHTWALPSLERAGIADRVEFRQSDLRLIESLDPRSIDFIVSDATLSAMGVYAVDAIERFFQILKVGGRLAIRDLLPEAESELAPENVAMRSWRLIKAVAHLNGQQHYEELPTDWIKTRLQAAGFKIDSLVVDPRRRIASELSRREWSQLTTGFDLPDGLLKRAVRASWNDLVACARQQGLTTKTGSYFCWAER